MRIRVLPLICIGLFACCDQQSPVLGQTKRKADIFTFEPGMSFVQTQAIITSSAYICKTSDKVLTTCEIKGVKVSIYYSIQLDDNPIIVVAADLADTKNFKETAISIASQYDVPLGERNPKGEYVWAIGNGNKLWFTGILHLSNPELTKRDNEADAKFVKSGTPKL